jgi:hypothetical protein
LNGWKVKPCRVLWRCSMRPENYIIIETIEQAKAALKAAAESDAEITLQTTPDAIFYAGSMYLLNMFRQAQAAYPYVKATFILDAGEAGAEVIAAIQDGHKNIKSNAKPEIRAKLRAIAAGHGVNFIENSGL